MTEMSQHSQACPKCGACLPVEATAGLCPRCLMEGALSQTMPDTLPMTDRERPSPADLAPHFPHLDILEYLGRGGMGVVYKARQKSLNRLVALKLLAPESVGDERFAKRFAKEAQALAALNHPNIVTIYDFGQAGGFYYLLMEFVDGVNLRQAMQASKFTPEEALAIVPPICVALQYAHEHGVVHRDIKPENLLLDKEGHVKIADFGIAKMLNVETTEVGVTESLHAGTPQYMAPEQKECRPTDHRADIYSLGVLLYELLTGELPGKPLTPPSKKVIVDVRLDEIVLRALDENPERRYQTIAEVKTLVETVASATEAQRQGLTTSARKHRLFTRVGIAVLLMSSIAATWTALNGIGWTAHSYNERKQQMNTNTSAAVLASLLAVTGCVETAQTKPGENVLPLTVLTDPSQLQYENLEVKRVSNGDSLSAGAYKYVPDNRAHSMLLELQPIDLSKASELRFEVKKDESYGRIKITLRDFENLVSDSIDVTPYISGVHDGYQVVRIPTQAFKTRGWDMQSVKLLFIGDQARRDKDGPSFSIRVIEAGFSQKVQPQAAQREPVVNLKAPKKAPLQGAVVTGRQSWASIGETKEEALKRYGEPTWIGCKDAESTAIGITKAQVQGEPDQTLTFYSNKEGKCILGEIEYSPKDKENLETLKNRILEVNSDGKSWTFRPGTSHGWPTYNRDGATVFVFANKNQYAARLDAYLYYCQSAKAELKRTAEKKDVSSDGKLTVPEKKTVTLTKPYPTADKGDATDKISVQYAVIELGKQAGLGYQWDESFKNTAPACQRWVTPNIKGKPFNAAMQALLDPVGLTYELRGNEIVLKKK